ncbi:hypothetical protein ACF061_04680 [Streptomyces sp. NPDC015220]|uniref:hypothetical protein n=1 Tax=Streptomyces sp. NPDC015220 TaxID=3364947 RepID=UPI0036FA0E68
MVDVLGVPDVVDVPDVLDVLGVPDMLGGAATRTPRPGAVGRTRRTARVRRAGVPVHRGVGAPG